MSHSEIKISVVIPISSTEIAVSKIWKHIQELKFHEIIFTGPNIKKHSFLNRKNTALKLIETTKNNRAEQMNQAALNASGTHLLFLHADSVFKIQHFEALKRSLKENPDKLHYFLLDFESDGPTLCKINAHLANLRSEFLKLPYGDQGLCISRNIFEDQNSFPASPWGEDFLWVRSLAHKKIAFQKIPLKLLSSARKYEKLGWLKCSYLHVKAALKLYKKSLYLPKGAFCLFVKTPGLSPCKTRLGKRTSQKFAEDFYQHSITCFKKLMEEISPSLDLYWALAEKSHQLPLKHPWSGYPLLEQKGLKLGTRLYSIQEKVFLRKHPYFVFCGADAPQLSTKELNKLVKFFLHSKKQERRAYCIPSPDGGYCVFAANFRIKEEHWSSIPYSSQKTWPLFYECLKKNYAPFKIEIADKIQDIDERSDLEKFLQTPHNTLREDQKKLLLWAKDSLSKL